MPEENMEALDNLCINTIRILSADAVQNANSGHPGMPMGAAAMAYTLWTRYLKYNPADPQWFDRDRFVLSAGHGSMLLYSLLYLTGYDLPLDELKRFRQWGSKTPGHPERGHTVGVEVATGPLGQGFSNGVGMAIAEAWLAARYNRPGHKIIDHHTYAICGDGDLMEGITQEAASLAGHLRLGKMIYLYDQNHISLAGATSHDLHRRRGDARFEAYGWHTQSIDNGNDIVAIAAAIEAAQKDPAALSDPGSHSHRLRQSEKAGQLFGARQVRWAKKNCRRRRRPSAGRRWISSSCRRRPSTTSARRFPKAQALSRSGSKRFDEYRKAYPSEAAELETMIAGKLPENWAADLPKWTPADKPIATRAAGGAVLNALAKRIPNIIGGSADLNPSTDTALKGFGDFQPAEFGGPGTQGAVGGEWDYGGRNVAFGVREHAMGAAVNGMAAHGGRAAVQRDVSGFLGLHEAGDPARRAESAQSVLRFHA